MKIKNKKILLIIIIFITIVGISGVIILRQHEQEFINIDSQLSNALTNSEAQFAPDKLIEEIVTLDGEYKIKLKLGANIGENAVTINGDDVIISNVYNLHLDQLTNNLYYSKYSLEAAGKNEDEYTEPTYEPIVFQYNLITKKESPIYTFENSKNLSYKINENTMVYSLNNNKIGIVNLSSSEETIFDITKLGNIPDLSTFVEHGDFNIIAIHELSSESFIINLSEVDKERFIRVSLDDLEIIEQI